MQGLLSRAADSIRQERVRSSTLSAENARLNEEVARLLHIVKQVYVDNAVLSNELASLRAVPTPDSSPPTPTAAVPVSSRPVESHTSRKSPLKSTAVPVASNVPVADDPTSYSDAMVSRLRRAVAPPPTREQMAALVDAMVTAIQPEFDRRGLGVEFVKVGKCLYQVGRRRLNLTVDSGRLVVKSGGGHTELLEYIERYIVV